MFSGELAAVLNSAAWAATGVTAKVLGPAMKPYHLITAHTVVAGLIFLVIMAATGGLAEMARAPASALLLFAAAAGLNTLGSYLFFTAVSSGTVGGTYTTVTGLYVLMSLLAGLIFFDEAVLPLAAAGAAAIVAGVYILNGPGKSKPRPAEAASTQVALPVARAADVAQSRGALPATRAGLLARPVGAWLPRGVVLAAVTAVLWTLGLMVLKWGLESSDALTAALLRNVVAAAVYIGVGVMMGRKAALPRAGRRDWTWVLVSAGFFTASTFLWNYALANTAAGKTAVLASTAPVFALALAVIFLRERMSALAVAGAAVATAGTLLVVVAG